MLDENECKCPLLQDFLEIQRGNRDEATVTRLVSNSMETEPSGKALMEELAGKGNSQVQAQVTNTHTHLPQYASVYSSHVTRHSLNSFSL